HRRGGRRGAALSVARPRRLGVPQPDPRRRRQPARAGLGRVDVGVPAAVPARGPARPARLGLARADSPLRGLRRGRVRRPAARAGGRGRARPGSLYAPQTLRDDRDRRILFGWLREGRSREAIEAAGWAGVLSLPWLLS